MEKISWPRKVKELTKGGVYHGNLNIQEVEGGIRFCSLPPLTL